MRRDRRNSLLTITIGAIITTVALFMFSLAYPQMFALFSLLFVFSMIIIGLSLLAYVPRIPALVISMIRLSVAKSRNEVEGEIERKRKEKWLEDINRVRRKMGLRPLRREHRGGTEK